MIVTGEGLPALPKKGVKKIQTEEFIDFMELPPEKGKVRGTPSSLGNAWGIGGRNLSATKCVDENMKKARRSFFHHGS